MCQWATQIIVMELKIWQRSQIWKEFPLEMMLQNAEHRAL